MQDYAIIAARRRLTMVTQLRIYICASRSRVDFVAHIYMRVAVRGLNIGS